MDVDSIISNRRGTGKYFCNMPVEGRCWQRYNRGPNDERQNEKLDIGFAVAISCLETIC